MAKRSTALVVVPEPAVPQGADLMALEVAWAKMMCAYCGACHHGLCRRVKRITKGAGTEVIEFWPEGRWKPAPGSVTWEDVFGAHPLLRGTA